MKTTRYSMLERTIFLDIDSHIAHFTFYKPIKTEKLDVAENFIKGQLTNMVNEISTLQESFKWSENIIKLCVHLTYTSN